MISVLNVNDLIDKINFTDSEGHNDLNTLSPSLDQGADLKKYQQKITKNTETNLMPNQVEDEDLDDIKEGYKNLDMDDVQISDDGLTAQSIAVLNQTSNTNNIANLKAQYSNVLKQYNKLVDEISGTTSDYLKRINPSNPYLNKIIKFKTGQYAYVTNQGVVKYIANKNMINLTKFVNVNLPWISSYSIPGTVVNTTPKLIIGTPLQKNQSLGNEGSNIFVDRLITNTNASYVGCYGDNLSRPTMTFVGSSPPQGNFIKNGNFSQPQLSLNTYSLIKSTSSVPSWSFYAYLVNSSSAIGFPLPYPSGTQCAAINRTQNLAQNVTLVANTKYTLSLMTVSSSHNYQNLANTIYVTLTSSSGKTMSVTSFTPSSSTAWQNISVSFTPQYDGTNTISFKGSQQNDCTTGIQNVSLLLYGETTTGTYNYGMCKQEAINAGVKYFALQNVNPSTNLGYCSIGSNEPSITKYGVSYVPTKQVALWASNTPKQVGNSFVLTTQGSISVVNSSGTSVYSTPNKNAAPSNYYGCYGDSGDRAMALYSGGSQQYSNSQCQQIASQNGYQYYGLQNSTSGTNAQCALSNNLSQSMRYGKAGNCTRISDGSWSGGGWSNAVYNTNNPYSNYFLILQDDGNMVIYRGSSPSDVQGTIWASNTVGKQQKSNPTYAATKGKYGKNWIPSGSTLAPGDFVGSNNGNLALIMQTDGNLVLYTFQNTENCSKMADSNMGGGVAANALNKLNEVGFQSNLAKLAYVDENSNIHTYPSSNIQLSTDYVQLKKTNSSGNDILGASYGNTTFAKCKSTCNSNKDCYGFVMSNEGNVCMPKTSGMYPSGSKQIDNNYTTYVRKRIPLNPPLGVSMNVNTVDSISYQNYINGGAFKNKYGLANATQQQQQQLASLQKQLNALASQIATNTTQFKNNNNLASTQSVKNIKGINTYLSDLNTTNTDITNFPEDINNILKDSDILVLQQNYDYLFWAILASGIVLVSMNVLK